MGELDHRTEPHVTRDELRDALRPGADTARRSPVLEAPAPRPAWNWATDLSDADREELNHLRIRAGELEAEIEQLQQAVERRREHESTLREALADLAAAKRRRRRRLLDDLRARRLV
jgi:predicted nuclease with TOPRIM domain